MHHARYDALVKHNFDGPDRQRALSYWSFGSWGGGGITSFFGGLVGTTLGWRWIFVFSIMITLLSMYLIKDVVESEFAEIKRRNLTFLASLSLSS